MVADPLVCRLSPIDVLVYDFSKLSPLLPPEPSETTDRKVRDHVDVVTRAFFLRFLYWGSQLLPN